MKNPRKKITKQPAPPEKPEIKKIPSLSDLPFSYGETKLVLMVRDPYWAYSYWDFSAETWNWAQERLREDPSLKPILRVYDLTAHRSCDLLIFLEAKNWYILLGIPDHRYVAELGLGDGKSRFLLIARSNEVQTPRDSPSDLIDPEWPVKDLEDLSRAGNDRNQSSPSSHSLQRQ